MACFVAIRPLVVLRNEQTHRLSPACCTTMGEPRVSFASATTTGTLDTRAKLIIVDCMMAHGASRLPTRPRNWAEGKAQSASGKAIVTWLISRGITETNDQAEDVATELVRARALVPLQRVVDAASAFAESSEAYYAHYGLSTATSRGLNVFAPAFLAGSSRPCFTVLRELSRVFARLVKETTLRGGLEVRYEKIRESTSWPDVLALVAELVHGVLDDNLSEDVKKATLFNLYNVLVIHGKLVYGHPKDITARSRFFGNIAYEIAQHRLDSTELEHAVLRLKMTKDHPLVALRLTKKDPRMHFVLNCGAQSCPPLVAIDVDHVEENIAEATSNFINNNVNIDPVQRRIVLSRLWKWFRSDFTPLEPDSDFALMQWIKDHASEAMSNEIEALLPDVKSRLVKISFAKYNWGDNGDWTTSDTAFMALYDYSFKKNA